MNLRRRNNCYSPTRIKRIQQLLAPPRDSDSRNNHHSLPQSRVFSGVAREDRARDNLEKSNKMRSLKAIFSFFLRIFLFVFGS